MREIKFRAWDKINKDMFNVESINFQERRVYKDTVSYREFEDMELMEYTGLKDKNNKEIYEGDIFHIGSKKILYVVEWIDCGLKGRQIKNKSWIGLDYWKDDIEVIGNIYENPELMEEVR